MNYSIEHKDWSTTIYNTLSDARKHLIKSDKGIALTKESIVIIDSVRQDTSKDR